MKTSELKGAALDWAVAKAEGYAGVALQERTNSDRYAPAYYWEQGGPIIEREKIDLFCNDGTWEAYCTAKNEGTDELQSFESIGETPLIAAMRCYVASKLGDEIDIPEELK